jgi:tetratricopeptide (TPR) repeat protein
MEIHLRQSLFFIEPRSSKSMRSNELPLRLALAIIIAIIGVALFGVHAADSARQTQDRIQRHRNLGKAIYETPTADMLAAAEEFRKALQLAPNSVADRLNMGLALLRAGKLDEGIAELDHAQKLDPSIPHTWFNLGLAFRKRGRIKEGIRQLEEFVRLVPDDAIGQHNLGLLYNLDDRPDQALRQFETARRLDPRLVAPYFQIYTLHRLAERKAESEEALQAFRRAKQRQEELGEADDVEWNAYAEIYEVIEPPLDEVPPTRIAFREVRLRGKLDPARAALVVLDADGDNGPDLMAWSRTGVQLYRNGSEPVAKSGLENVKDIIGIEPGDFDNDGLADLCLLHAGGAALYRNEKGVFQKAPASLPDRQFEVAAWLDYDHDGDLDLLLFGEKPALLRNQGAGGFADRSADFPFVAGRAVAAAVIRTVSDTKALDLAVSYAGRAAVLYRDRLRGRYEPETVGAIPAYARSLKAFDVNNDGWLDLALTTGESAGVAINRRGTLRSPAINGRGGTALTFADLTNRGRADLVSGATVLRINKAGNLDAVPAPAALSSAIAWAAADFDRDGKVDLAKAGSDGTVRLLLNQTAAKGQWISVALEGVKTAKLAPGAEVEVKAGASYQKRLYEGVPLLFGLGPFREVDTVRITWPNGNIQNETRQAAGRRASYKEAPRLSGSCPIVFTWNGREFQFITDVLGVAPLGASSGDGGFFPVDHDEYVQIPAGALVPNLKGQYEIRITEELKEVSYLDKVQLIAVDHPAHTEIFTNDKFKSPPFPAFRLFGVRNRRYPVHATDHRGRDTLPQVLRRDRRYPDDFRRNHSGIAELHTLDLDFGRDAASANRAVLVLHGWTDWADGSTFLRASQEPGGGLVLPYLQVKDANGAWRTVIEDMGIPAGKPKTIAVDLTGKFLSPSREVRLVTNLCLYWDEIFLSEDTAAPEVRLTPLNAATADLRFRGFSRPLIHPERKQPEAFDYGTVSAVSIWNPTPGLYTRYGEVAELAHGVDDRYIIMGSGDELRLLFDGSRLPPVRPGWTRDFLFMVDGWAKDGDANTAFGGSVEPLPFHAMSRYPFPATEAPPQSAAHKAYRDGYNTRRPARLVPRLR